MERSPLSAPARRRYDGNLRHFFENRKIQGHLFNSGMIDQEGRVIDVTKNKSKLFIIEQEFKKAERQEYWRAKEESEMRRRVQKKRHETLDLSRRTNRMVKAKEDRRIAQEILRAGRDAVTMPPPPRAKGSSRKFGGAPSSQQSSFFLTSAQSEPYLGMDSSMGAGSSRGRDASMMIP